jgi:hypothetical protein
MYLGEDELRFTKINESRVGVFVHRYLSNPRLILGSFGVLMTGISISTYLNEPGYLVFPYLYMVAGIIGAGASFTAMIHPNKWSLALSGSLIAGAVTARGIGLMLSAFDGPWRGDVSWTFIVGALAYFVILTMLPPVWFRYLIPWTVEKVR